MKLIMSMLLTLFFFHHSGQASEIIRQQRFSEPYDSISPQQVPWLVNIKFNNARATGILITRRHVLGTAHKLNTQGDPTSWRIVFPNYDSDLTIAVSSVEIHPEYNSLQFDHDIAVYTLADPMPEDLALPIINPIRYTCLDVYYISEPRSVCHSVDGELKEVSLSWLYGAGCSSTHRCPLVYLLNYPGQSAPGDSGSPLFVDIYGYPYILGLHIGEQIRADFTRLLFEPITNNLNFIIMHTGLQFEAGESANAISGICPVQNTSLPLPLPSQELPTALTPTTPKKSDAIENFTTLLVHMIFIDVGYWLSP